MSIITQPPQATLTIIRRSGKKHLIAGTEEDIAWLVSLFSESTRNKLVQRFLAARVSRIEHREFEQLVTVIELEMFSSKKGK